MFVSSATALDMMAAHAPRAWCKRVLMWQIFDGGLSAWFANGTIAEMVYPFQVEFEDKKEAGLEASAALSETLGKPNLQAFNAAKVAINKNEWADEYRWIPIAAFLFADERDWEAGRLKGSLFDDADTKPFLQDSDEFNPEMDRSEFEFELSGMAFDLETIEMLAPGGDAKGAQPQALHASTPTQRANLSRAGRPAKYDWEGAIAHVAALANHPDGLPTGSGAQAEIARRIADWFEGAGGDCPADSEIRRRAARIMQAIGAV